MPGVARIDDVNRYRPIFSINRSGWWLHQKPAGDRQTVIASAAE
jgi:hypothetical protein